MERQSFRLARGMSHHDRDQGRVCAGGVVQARSHTYGMHDPAEKGTLVLDAVLTSKLDERLARFDALEGMLNDPAGAAQPNYPDLLREYGSLRESMTLYRAYREACQELAYNEALSTNTAEDAELRQMAKEEIPALREACGTLADQISEMVSGASADDNKNVILEIRAGTGGDEAALFAGDLYRMYSSYAATRGWTVEEVSAHPGEQGGFREVILGLQGENVYRDLKYEGGGHRVQRVPVTESQGRIHTSAATVAVLPEAEEYEIEIHQQDLRIETVRATGPGGQSVNTTDSAVRITHLPTGLIVHIADEKSQLKNKAKALRVLRSRLYEMKMREEEEARAAERKGQVGTGDRSERVRTYNFPQDRCTDHRLGRNFSLNDIITGKLDKLIEAMNEYGKQQQLAGQA